MDVVFLGAGNVATHLSVSMQKAGHRIVQVYSRTEESASVLATRLECSWTTSVEEISPLGQLYVFCLKDAVLTDFSRQVYEHLRTIATPGHPDCGAGALFVHTAGSMPLDVLPSLRRGVFYPMQSFSKSRTVDFSVIPVFIESETDAVLLGNLAKSISTHVYLLSSSERKYLHLAAVFANNFTNHMYDLSARMLERHGIPFEVMLPLIDETARKVHEMEPRKAQTGPAVRYDENVMQQQLSLIEEENVREMYKLISRSIHDKL